MKKYVVKPVTVPSRSQMPSHCKVVTADTPSNRRKSTLSDLPKIPLQVGCRDKAGIRSAQHSAWYQEVS